MKDLPTMTRLALAAALLLAATPAMAQTTWQQHSASGNAEWQLSGPPVPPTNMMSPPTITMWQTDARGCRPVFIPGQGYQTQCGY